MSIATAVAEPFSEWLLLRRRRAGLNQQALADALGVRRQAVSNWEQSKSKPALDPVQSQRLCEMLGVTFEDLVAAFRAEG